MCIRDSIWTSRIIWLYDIDESFDISIYSNTGWVLFVLLFHLKFDTLNFDKFLSNKSSKSFEKESGVYKNSKIIKKKVSRVFLIIELGKFIVFF